MTNFRTTLAAAAAFAAAFIAFDTPAQGINAGQCILAGRVNDQQKWAPRFREVELLAAKGRVITVSERAALTDTQQVRVTKPALLTKCNGDEGLKIADDEPAVPKEPVPAVAPGIYEVESVAFPKLRRGGELVEVKLKLPVERVVMVKR